MASLDQGYSYESFPRYQRELSADAGKKGSPTHVHSSSPSPKKKTNPATMPSSIFTPPHFQPVSSDTEASTGDYSDETSDDSYHVLDLLLIANEATALRDKLTSKISLILEHGLDILELHRISKAKAVKGDEIAVLASRLALLKKKHEKLLAQ